MFVSTNTSSQFYLGADQSYVNEMEDCGADFKEDGQSKDVYQIFEDYGCNLVRLRLWHTPSWYDDLNDGRRYSDIADVKKSIQRAKDKGMDVLLNFHLSDNWADPSKQIIPAAWLEVADNLEVLQDSLYNYISNTLATLDAEGLLPEMVQIGNETNRGILLTPEQNQQWTLDWDRNAPLFNSAISAVRDVSTDIKIALHLADPSEAEWLLSEFIEHGVTDFDVVAMSYYWAWHMPVTIEQTGEVISRIKTNYPGKEVLIVETGYIWTMASQDQAGNIISEVHPDYSPASATNQKDWLIALTEEVISHAGMGVVYWEPSWVSTSCSTQWGQGSHQEHATFFDFDHNLLIPGGIEWMNHSYETTNIKTENVEPSIRIKQLKTNEEIEILIKGQSLVSGMQYMVSDTSGQVILKGPINNVTSRISYQGLPNGMIIVTVYNKLQKESKQFSIIR